MSKLSFLKDSLYNQLSVHSGRERRHLLIQEMQTLNNKKVDCYNCSGTCCTFSSNSMQITPIEAFEILLSLEVTSETLPELKNKLQKNIVDYRLDHEIFLGKKNKSFLRKTYTCPFFFSGAKGCSIKKDLKPYGCLGFNPRIENDNGGLCHSNREILEQRENLELNNEELANNFLKQELKLDWAKLEIPKAVLAIIERIF